MTNIDKDDRYEFMQLTKNKTPQVISNILTWIRQQKLSATFASIIKKQDKETASHSKRVAVMAEALAKKIKLSRKEIKKIKQSGRLHDLGKISIPEEILNKPGTLTDEEYKYMQKHPNIGREIIEQFPEFQKEASLVHHHHEWFNGNGYPSGISKYDIPLGSRIIAIADAYDAMTSDRVYRKALPKEEALKRIRNGKGSQFDPIIADAFVQLIVQRG